MSFAVPTFSPEQFELRGYTNPFLTEEQQTAVSLVENRVNSQLDWVAQLLGWNGPNYWSNFATSVDQKRQMLTGTYGVYNSFFIPEIISIQNWDNKVVVVKDLRIQVGQRIYLNQNVYAIQGYTEQGEQYFLDIGTLTDQFFSDIAANFPLEIVAPETRPAPFYRPQVGISGDQSFVCGSTSTQLTLYPGYDTQKKTPFKINILFAGSFYYFDQNVYITYDGVTKNIVSEYDQSRNRWYLQIPETLTSDQAGLTATLVWPQYDTVSGVTLESTLLVTIFNWTNPSDWNSRGALEHFRGTWGNKGGFLPFNFAFDALSLHGFSEERSLYLAPVTREIPFNDLLQLIYYQQLSISLDPPPTPNIGDLWWNSGTGALSVRNGSDSCAAWVQIDYRELPDFNVRPDFIYFDVAGFELAKDALPINAYALIVDISNINPSNNITGIQGTLLGSAQLYLFKITETYWMPYKFVYEDENEFNTDSLNLPYGIPVDVLDSDGITLNDPTKNYDVDNLLFTIGSPNPENMPVTLTKYYTNRQWLISPDSILKYIANTRLFSDSITPLQGETWWDYDNVDTTLRVSDVYYQEAWVEMRRGISIGGAPTLLNIGSAVIYCNGQLIQEGQQYRSENFVFSYIYDATLGNFVFNYNPFNSSAQISLPVISVSDSITSVFREDITEVVFSGLQYYMSPNVQDAETTLRLWKLEALQVVETVDLLDQKIYSNPLRADLNSGPGPTNWEKFFVRLPPSYQRNGFEWQKVNLTCQNFTNFGSTPYIEKMECPPEDETPLIYEELYLFRPVATNQKTVYSEPYFYSNVVFSYGSTNAYENSAVFPTQDLPFDEFLEGQLITYDPLHNRRAVVDLGDLDVRITAVQAQIETAILTNDVTNIQFLSRYLEILSNKRFGDWEGVYLSTNVCDNLTGFWNNDLLTGAIEKLQPPVWDASIYKYAPTCNNNEESYYVDANHYKVGYAYFAADLSAAEDGFFDIQQEWARRYPQTQPKTGYLTPQAVGG